MIEITPFEVAEIIESLSDKAKSEFNITDSEYEGSNILQLVNLIAYASNITNTNFSFGLNEMFISTAIDRNNIIKHARQLGYIHNRVTSYEYKIRVKSNKKGELIIPKYMPFKSGNNNYVYNGDTLIEKFGNYFFLSLLNNENNNNINNVNGTWFDENINQGDYIVSEQGIISEVLEVVKYPVNRLLLREIGTNDIPSLSYLGKDIYIQDQITPYNEFGYRNFIKVGHMDNFAFEETLREGDYYDGIVKIQLSPIKDLVFPFYTTIINPTGTLVKQADGLFAIRMYDHNTGEILPEEWDAQFDENDEYILNSGQFHRWIDGEYKTVGTRYPVKFVNKATLTIDDEILDLDTCNLVNDDGTLSFNGHSIAINEVHPADTVKNYGLHTALIVANKEILIDEPLELIIYFTTQTTTRLGDGNVYFIDGRWMFIDGSYALPASGDYVPDDLLDDGLSVIQDGSYILVDGQYIFVDGNHNWLKDAYHKADGEYVYVDGQYKLVDGTENYFMNAKTEVFIDGNVFLLDGNINYPLNAVNVTDGRYVLVNEDGSTRYIRLDTLTDGANTDLTDGNFLYVDGEFEKVDPSSDSRYVDGMTFTVDGGTVYVDGNITDMTVTNIQYVYIDGEYRIIDNSTITGDGYRKTLDGLYVFIDGNYTFIDGNVPQYVFQKTMTQEELDEAASNGDVVYMDGNIIFTDGDEIFFLEQNGDTLLYEGDSINASVTKIQRVDKKDLIINDRNIIVPEITTFVSCWKSKVCGARIETPFFEVKSVQSIAITTPDGQEFIHEEYRIEENVIVLTVNGEPIDCYPENSDLCIDLEYYENVARSNMILKYSFNDIPDGARIDITYSYDKDADGYLDRTFFFSDLRGEVIENELKWASSDIHALTFEDSRSTKGFDGFTAYDYDPETNILYFSVTNRTGLAKKYTYQIDEILKDTTITDIEKETLINNIDIPENYYEHLKESNYYIDRPLIDVLDSPFKKTRFSLCTNTDLESCSFDINTTFAKVDTIESKEYLELIVKEGIVKKYNEVTTEYEVALEQALINNTELPEPEYKYPDLTIMPNQTMIDDNKIIIKNTNIEENGIEMFIEEYDGYSFNTEEWEEREYLLAEYINLDDNTFVTMSNETYEDYIDIYTYYAGSGRALSADMKIMFNILESKGSLGYTNEEFISLNEDIEVVDIDGKTSILMKVGADKESDESIKENAVLVSNTGNRTVTSEDYYYVINAQPYIDETSVWGGEDNYPINLGYVYISTIPISRPKVFDYSENSYILSNKDDFSVIYNTYYQITGKENYLSVDSGNKSLFSLLDKYCDINTRFIYNKPIYMDFNIEVNLLKTLNSQSPIVTMKNIFEAIKDYFKIVEKFNGEFYKSSLIRYIDSVIGNNYGITTDIVKYISIKDDLYDSNNSNFINRTLLDTKPNIDGIYGANDDWLFNFNLGLPLEDMFEESIIKKLVFIKRGRLKMDVLTSIETVDFITKGDLLYLQPNVYRHYSEDVAGNPEFILNTEGDRQLSNENSSLISIPIMYRLPDYKEGDIEYKVGEYIIRKKYGTIDVNVNSNYNDNIYNNRIIIKEVDGLRFFLYNNPDKPATTDLEYETEDIEGTIVYKWFFWNIIKDINGVVITNEKVYLTEIIMKESIKLDRFNNPYTTYYYALETPITLITGDIIDIIDEIKVDSYIDDEGILNKDVYIEKPFDRKSFLVPRQLSINSMNDNIKVSRHTFMRLTEINFSI